MIAGGTGIVHATYVPPVPGLGKVAHFEYFVWAWISSENTKQQCKENIIKLSIRYQLNNYNNLHNLRNVSMATWPWVLCIPRYMAYKQCPNYYRKCFELNLNCKSLSMNLLIIYLRLCLLFCDKCSTLYIDATIPVIYFCSYET